jgi:hypothetical protein
VRFQGSEFGEDFGGETFFGGLVVLAAAVGDVDLEEQEVVLAEGVEVGRGAGGRGDEEGVLADAGDGDEAAGGLHLGVDDVVVVAGLEADVDAVLTLGVLPGAVGGIFGAAGGAGVHGHANDGLDLVGGEEVAGGLGVGRGGDEGGCSGDQESRADHAGVRCPKCLIAPSAYMVVTLTRSQT